MYCGDQVASVRVHDNTLRVANSEIKDWTQLLDFGCNKL